MARCGRPRSVQPVSQGIDRLGSRSLRCASVKGRRKRWFTNRTGAPVHLFRLPAQARSYECKLIEGRDLNEHWIENLPVFLVRPRSREPRYPSGKNFAERNPEAGPYWWLGWSSAERPQVLPNVSARAIHELVDRVEEAVLARDPGFRRFVPVRQLSPWLGEDAGRARWWPRPQDAETP